MVTTEKHTLGIKIILDFWSVGRDVSWSDADPAQAAAEKFAATLVDLPVAFEVSVRPARSTEVGGGYELNVSKGVLERMGIDYSHGSRFRNACEGIYQAAIDGVPFEAAEAA